VFLPIFRNKVDVASLIFSPWDKANAVSGVDYIGHIDVESSLGPHAAFGSTRVCIPA
ncbi:hypothetical protein XENOCAPTIV_006306, partial [Xenoophorus captivus]